MLYIRTYNAWYAVYSGLYNVRYAVYTEALQGGPSPPVLEAAAPAPNRCIERRPPLDDAVQTAPHGRAHDYILQEIAHMHGVWLMVNEV